MWLRILQILRHVTITLQHHADWNFPFDRSLSAIFLFIFYITHNEVPYWHLYSPCCRSARSSKVRALCSFCCSILWCDWEFCRLPHVKLSMRHFMLTGIFLSIDRFVQFFPPYSISHVTTLFTGPSIRHVIVPRVHRRCVLYCSFCCSIRRFDWEFCRLRHVKLSMR